MLHLRYLSRTAFHLVLIAALDVIVCKWSAGGVLHVQVPQEDSFSPSPCSCTWLNSVCVCVCVCVCVRVCVIHRTASHPVLVAALDLNVCVYVCVIHWRCVLQVLRRAASCTVLVAVLDVIVCETATGCVLHLQVPQLNSFLPSPCTCTWLNSVWQIHSRCVLQVPQQNSLPPCPCGYAWRNSMWVIHWMCVLQVPQ